MKVVIAIDDISLPLPPMRRPDVRERVLTIVLEMLADHGVDDVEMIIATSVHRRMTGDEVRHIVGDKIFDAYWPEPPLQPRRRRPARHEVRRHDRARRGGRAQPQGRRERPRHLREPEPRPHGRRPQVGRGRASAATRACARTTTRKVMRDCHSYMDPATSALADERRAHGARSPTRRSTSSPSRRRSTTACSIGRSSSCTRTRTTSPAPSARRSRRSRSRSSKLPQAARQAIFQRVPSPYGVTGVFAGETEAVHAHTLERSATSSTSCRSRGRPTSSSRASRTSARTT